MKLPWKLRGNTISDCDGHIFMYTAPKGDPGRKYDLFIIKVMALLPKLKELSEYDSNHDNILYNMKEINELIRSLLK